MYGAPNTERCCDNGPSTRASVTISGLLANGMLSQNAASIAPIERSPTANAADASPNETMQRATPNKRCPMRWMR